LNELYVRGFVTSAVLYAVNPYRFNNDFEKKYFDVYFLEGICAPISQNMHICLRSEILQLSVHRDVFFSSNSLLDM
jgi:hypothetical protein